MVIPVILSGGTGTRLWPISREAHPKPFIKLADGQSLLQKTFLRASNLPYVTEIITITNREYLHNTQEDFSALASSQLAQSFLLEPFGRNTAPAILLAAFKIKATYGANALLLVLPADHLIEVNGFNSAVEQACQLAKQNKLVTFGIVPTEPETAFGYIETESDNPFAVKRFVEKPTSEVAKEYLQSGNYLWNAGMFCFTAETVIQQFKQYSPELFQAAETCWEITQTNRFNTSQITELDSASFAKVPDISIDYALLEKSNSVAVVPSHFAWNDIGSWDRMIKLFESDHQGNIANGETIMIDSNNTFIHSENRLVASIGVNNLIVVDTPDALLIADRNRSQDVKTIVQKLKATSHESYKNHRTATRPWGTYTVLEESQHFKIKQIKVKPGASLSLQMHHHRSEHWVIVSGTAKVTNGDQVFILNTNESTFIPQGHQHRLENPGTVDLILIEVQTGSYLGEDDIVRFDDKYGRRTEGTYENSDCV